MALFMKYPCSIVIASFLMLAPAGLTAQSGQSSDTLNIFPKDSTDAQIENWNVIEFDDIEPATYSIDLIEGDLIITGESDGEASGIGKAVAFRLEDYPVMEWRWKVDELPEDGNAKKKKGDDYGARIYITFKFEKFQGNVWDRAKYWTVRNIFRVENLPFRSLNYIWANRVEKGKMLPNPFTDWVMMMPVESGTEHLSEWRTYRRNVLEDYKQAFDEDPSQVTGILFMTDSDNSNGTSRAQWGYVRFLKE